MRSAPFEIRPLAGALGAELRGIDLSDDLAAATVLAIRRALLDHLVVFFRDQDLSPERFLALSRGFGDPIEYPFVKGIAGFPEIIAVSKLPGETVNFGGVWHSDTTYLREPPMATLLVAREVPDAGGDTLFASQYACVRGAVGRHEGAAGRAEGGVQFGEGRFSAAPARTASAPTAAPRRGNCWLPSIRWCAPIRRPGAARCTSTAPTRSASPA